MDSEIKGAVALILFQRHDDGMAPSDLESSMAFVTNVETFLDPQGFTYFCTVLCSYGNGEAGNRDVRTAVGPLLEENKNLLNQFWNWFSPSKTPHSVKGEWLPEEEAWLQTGVQYAGWGKWEEIAKFYVKNRRVATVKSYAEATFDRKHNWVGLKKKTSTPKKKKPTEDDKMLAAAIEASLIDSAEKPTPDRTPEPDATGSMSTPGLGGGKQGTSETPIEILGEDSEAGEADSDQETSLDLGTPDHDSDQDEVTSLAETDGGHDENNTDQRVASIFVEQRKRRHTSDLTCALEYVAKVKHSLSSESYESFCSFLLDNGNKQHPIDVFSREVAKHGLLRDLDDSLCADFWKWFPPCTTKKTPPPPPPPQPEETLPIQPRENDSLSVAGEVTESVSSTLSAESDDNRGPEDLDTVFSNSRSTKPLAASADVQNCSNAASNSGELHNITNLQPKTNASRSLSFCLDKQIQQEEIEIDVERVDVSLACLFERIEKEKCQGQLDKDRVEMVARQVESLVRIARAARSHVEMLKQWVSPTSKQKRAGQALTPLKQPKRSRLYNMEMKGNGGQTAQRQSIYGQPCNLEALTSTPRKSTPHKMTAEEDPKVIYCTEHPSVESLEVVGYDVMQIHSECVEMKLITPYFKESLWWLPFHICTDDTMYACNICGHVAEMPKKDAEQELREHLKDHHKEAYIAVAELERQKVKMTHYFPDPNSTPLQKRCRKNKRGARRA